MLADPADASLRPKFNAAVAALADESSDDAKEFARQIPVALSVFEKLTFKT